MAEGVQSDLVQAAQVIHETTVRHAANGIRYAVVSIQRHQRRAETFNRRDEARVQARGGLERLDGLLVLAERIERGSAAVIERRKPIFTGR